jgi:hypothetical protein
LRNCLANQVDEPARNRSTYILEKNGPVWRRENQRPGDVPRVKAMTDLTMRLTILFV